jgi:predicted DNA-binding protein (UPF0251 family)
MDDAAYRRFFTEPEHVYQRQYEALRAVFVDGKTQKEAAEEFGFEHHSLRQLVYEFRKSQAASQAKTESPFFAAPLPEKSR